MSKAGKKMKWVIASIAGIAFLCGMLCGMQEIRSETSGSGHSIAKIERANAAEKPVSEAEKKKEKTKEGTDTVLTEKEDSKAKKAEVKNEEKSESGKAKKERNERKVVKHSETERVLKEDEKKEVINEENKEKQEVRKGTAVRWVSDELKDKTQSAVEEKQEENKEEDEVAENEEAPEEKQEEEQEEIRKFFLPDWDIWVLETDEVREASSCSDEGICRTITVIRDGEVFFKGAKFEPKTFE